MLSVLSAVERLLLPLRCLSCERTLPSSWTDGPLCGACRLELRPLQPPRCGRCGQTLDRWDTGAPCGFCRQWPQSLRWAASAVWHEGPARDLVHALKYDGWRVAAEPMARAIMRHCGHLLDRESVLVPVPLGRTRQRERGHNQAGVLARALGALCGLDVCDALERARETRTQTALSPLERMRNVSGAFRVAPAAGSPAAKVILVDDVLTTGATLGAAAEALSAAGCRAAGAITFARALSPT